MALFMVQNDLSEEDIYAKGDVLDFPASVVEFFEGRIGVLIKASLKNCSK